MSYKIVLGKTVPRFKGASVSISTDHCAPDTAELVAALPAQYRKASFKWQYTRLPGVLRADLIGAKGKALNTIYAIPT